MALYSDTLLVVEWEGERTGGDISRGTMEAIGRPLRRLWMILTVFESLRSRENFTAESLGAHIVAIYRARQVIDTATKSSLSSSTFGLKVFDGYPGEY
jgi:hypothetical protein